MQRASLRFQLIVALVALLVAGYFVRAAVVEARATITTLEMLSAEEAGKSAVGAVVVHGTVRAADVAAPAALSGANAYTSRVGRWVKSGKSSRFQVACELTRVDGLTFEDSATKKSHVLRGYDLGAIGFPTGVTGILDRAAVDFSHVTKSSTEPRVSDVAIPDRIKAECGDTFAAGSFEYQERYIEKGDEITVRGCSKDGFVTPCGDGFDYVTAGSVASMKSATRDHHTGKVAGGGLALFLALGIIGIISSRAVVRSSRKGVAT